MGDRSSGDRVAVDWGRSSLSEDQEANLEFFSFRNGNPFLLSREHLAHFTTFCTLLYSVHLALAGMVYSTANVHNYFKK